MLNFFEFIQITFFVKSCPFSPVAHVCIDLHAVVRIWGIAFTPFIDLGGTFNLLNFGDLMKLAHFVNPRPVSSFIIVPVAILFVMSEASLAPFCVQNSFLIFYGRLFLISNLFNNLVCYIL